MYKSSMLTTKDNPFNPFTNFKEWNTFDEQKGYYTCAFLARIIKSSPELSDADQSLANDQAIEDILSMDPTGIYIKVSDNRGDTNGK